MQNPAAVLALLDSSEKLRVKHLEFKFQRRRLLRATQTSSRAWYVSAEAWVSGKRPHSEAVSGVFFGTEVSERAQLGDVSLRICVSCGIIVFWLLE
mmetsp:Transcript_36304/g.86173  ORF Transcript_36304/g.86173 Transcript_36304/m.86173 type:complete len:96 (+) Transcript_36304:2214-2501(+)